MTILSPIIPEMKLDDEEAIYGKTDHSVPALGRCRVASQRTVRKARFQRAQLLRLEGKGRW